MIECDWGGKRFGSDMNIVSRGWCCNHSSISPRAAHSSDIEIHYPPDQVKILLNIFKTASLLHVFVNTLNSSSVVL